MSGAGPGPQAWGACRMPPHYIRVCFRATPVPYSRLGQAAVCCSVSWRRCLPQYSLKLAKPQAARTASQHFDPGPLCFADMHLLRYCHSAASAKKKHNKRSQGGSNSRP